MRPPKIPTFRPHSRWWAGSIRLHLCPGLPPSQRGVRVSGLRCMSDPAVTDVYCVHSPRCACLSTPPPTLGLGGLEPPTFDHLHAYSLCQREDRRSAI